MPNAEKIEPGLNDDFSEYTIIKDDGTLDNIQADEDEEGEEENQIEDKEFADLDEVVKSLPKDLPEDQREAISKAFEKVQTAYKNKLSKIESIQNQADFANALVEKLKQAVPPQTQSPVEKKQTVEEKKGLRFKFEDNDYYKPAFEEIASSMSEIQKSIDELRTGVSTDKKANFQKEVRTFFSQNKVTPAIIQKMDEIATEYGDDADGNKIMYKNLPRLMKMAKVELGIKDTVPKKKQSTNVKRQVESSSNRKSVNMTTQKTPKTVKEAWDLAEEQLAEQQ